jgi:hypothetical protein
LLDATFVAVGSIALTLMSLELAFRTTEYGCRAVAGRSDHALSALRTTALEIEVCAVRVNCCNTATTVTVTAPRNRERN